MHDWMANTSALLLVLAGGFSWVVQLRPPEFLSLLACCCAFMAVLTVMRSVAYHAWWWVFRGGSLF